VDGSTAFTLPESDEVSDECRPVLEFFAVLDDWIGGDIFEEISVGI
jgi:hypothetical protein